MGLFSKPIKTLDDLFVHTLQDIYYAENRITKALPKMIDKATDPQLKQGFELHLQETRNQIVRLPLTLRNAEPVSIGIGKKEQGERPEFEGELQKGREALFVGHEALLDHFMTLRQPCHPRRPAGPGRGSKTGYSAMDSLPSPSARRERQRVVMHRFRQWLWRNPGR